MSQDKDAKCRGGKKKKTDTFDCNLHQFRNFQNGEIIFYLFHEISASKLFIYNISRCISSHTQTLIIFFYAKIFALLLLHIIILSGIFLLKSKCRPSMVVLLLHIRMQLQAYKSLFAIQQDVFHKVSSHFHGGRASCSFLFPHETVLEAIDFLLSWHGGKAGRR